MLHKASLSYDLVQTSYQVTYHLLVDDRSSCLSHLLYLHEISLSILTTSSPWYIFCNTTSIYISGSSYQAERQYTEIMATTKPTHASKLSISSTSNDVGAPTTESRDDAKKNMLKAMRPLPTQHYWDVYFDRYFSPPPTTNLYLLSFFSLPCQLFTNCLLIDNKRKPPSNLENTPPPSNVSVLKSNPCKISGGIATTHL